jgi:hypothetical protein
MNEDTRILQGFQMWIGKIKYQFSISNTTCEISAWDYSAGSALLETGDGLQSCGGNTVLNEVISGFSTWQEAQAYSYNRAIEIRDSK